MPPKEYKILLLGSVAVGKSAIVTRFVSDRFLQEYDFDFEELYTKKLVVDGEERTLNILDCSGREEFSALRDQYIRDTQGIILVYTIVDSRSFSEVNDEFYKEALCVKDTDDIPIVLVGCKCDLTSERQVSFDQGEELAQKWGCPFFEVSTKENIHVEDVFAEIVRQIDKHEKSHSDTGEEDEKPKKEKKKRSFNPFNKYKFMDDI